MASGCEPGSVQEEQGGIDEEAAGRGAVPPQNSIGRLVDPPAFGVGVPLGLALERLSCGSVAALRAIGLLKTIPGLALVAFILPLFGIGLLPALVAVSLYALYPIARNTLTGVRSADPAAVAASTALGMSPGQVLRLVRLPLAAPVIMAGVRTAAVIDVGTASVTVVQDDRLSVVQAWMLKRRTSGASHCTVEVPEVRLT